MSDPANWDTWAYVAACVFLPALWGGLCAWIFARRDQNDDNEPDHAPIDYMI